MLLYHVLAQPHVCAIAPPPELRYLSLLRLIISEHLLYLNPLYPSIQNNPIIYIIPPSYSDLCLPLSDFHPTPASDSAQNYMTYC